MAVTSPNRLEVRSEEPEGVFLDLPASGTMLELFPAQVGRRLLFKPTIRGDLSSAFVLSVPKAGTYLFAKLLTELGYVDTEIHIWLEGFSDYRFRSIKDKMERAASFTVDLPIEISAGLIGPGQFAVGHVPFLFRSARALAGFTRVLIIRDIRDCMVSLMRFLQQPGRHDPAIDSWVGMKEGPAKMSTFLAARGEYWLGIMTPAAWWSGDSDTATFRFEDLAGDAGPDVQAQALTRAEAHFGLAPDPGLPDRFRNRVLGSCTLTFSGQRSNRDVYWSDEVEAKFGALGGSTLNAQLGYPA